MRVWCSLCSILLVSTSSARRLLADVDVGCSHTNVFSGGARRDMILKVVEISGLPRQFISPLLADVTWAKLFSYFLLGQQLRCLSGCRLLNFRASCLFAYYLSVLLLSYLLSLLTLH